MKYGTYRTNAFKTLQPKAAKLGLRVLAKNTLHTNEAKSITGLNIALGALTQTLSPYLLGQQITSELKENVASSLGEFGFYLILLAKLTKAKAPTATKKVKVTGTLTAAFLKLHGHTTELLNYVDGVFVGPTMKLVTKEVTNPGTGEKEMREVSVMDTELEALNEAERQSQITAMISELATIYWQFVFSFTGKVPMQLFERHMGILSERYPGITFAEDAEAEPEEATEEVAEAVAAK